MRYRWSHRNHPQAIAERQALLRQRPDWTEADEWPFRWSVDPERLGRFQECLTGEMVLPVGVVGPLLVSLGQYTIEDGGVAREVGRATDTVFVPLAHTEGGLSASMLRGMRAAEAAGGVRTYLLRDAMTRDSAFVFRTPAEAVALAEWVRSEEAGLVAWCNDPANPLKQPGGPGHPLPVMSQHARLLGVDTRVVGPVCHLLYRFWTGEACGPNMMTRNAYALNRRVVELSRLVPDHVFLEANLGGDKKPSHEYYAGGHGKTVLATVTLTHDVLRHHLHITAEALKTLEWVGLHGAHASAMQSFGFTPASAVAAIFAATGQDLGMVGTSSMAQGSLHAVPEGITFSLQLGGLEVGTVGGGTGLPHARAWLRMMGCEGPGSAQRLAQIIAAATLCLEVSAAASMASRGSENFFRAHWERGGHRN